MKKLSYQEQLNSEEWKEKRLLILKRDNFRCVKCGYKGILHVHHKLYEKGKMAWEAKDVNLITLCKKCHDIEHIKPINTFVKKPKVVKKKKLTAFQKRNNKILLEMKKSRKSQNRFNKYGS